LLDTRMALEGSPVPSYIMAAPCRHATSCAGPTPGSSPGSKRVFPRPNLSCAACFWR